MEAVESPDNKREQELVRLVDTYQSSLRRMCCTILRDRTLAEDAVQETFLKAYKALDNFRQDCSEKTWLMRIAINTCRDFRRSAWFRYLDRRITPEDLPLASNPMEEESVELTAAIMRLPQKLQEATLLHYYQNMTVREIAEALQTPQSTVSARLIRARAKLRTFLERGESLWMTVRMLKRFDLLSTRPFLI